MGFLVRYQRRRGPERRVDGGARRCEPVRYPFQLSPGTEIVVRRDGLARFLHGSICCGNLGRRLAQETARCASAPRGRHTGARPRQQGRNLRERALDLGADLRFGVGGLAGGVLGVLPALERVVQRQTIVAGGGGIVGVFERHHGRGVLRACVPFRASGACRVDGSLRLVHLLVGRRGAGGHEQRGDDQRRQRPSTHEDLSIAMKAVPPHDRPREKLERLGAAGLGDNELLALVLGSGARGIDVLELANRLVERAGGLHGLTRASPGDLKRVSGIGRARAAQILAAVEVGRRTLLRGVADRPRLTSPRQLAAYLLPQYGAGVVEQFGIVLLDTRHRVIRIKIVSIGSLDSTVVHPREVFREAASASRRGDRAVPQPPVR